MNPRLVEFAGLLVVSHHRLYLPSLRICQIDFLHRHVEIVFQDDGPEPFLLCRPDTVVEGIAPSLLSVHLPFVCANSGWLLRTPPYEYMSWVLASVKFLFTGFR